MSPFLSSLLRFFKKPAVLGWLVFFLLFSVVAMLTYQRFLLYDAARTRELNNAVINAREKLKTALNSGLSATKTLSFIIERYYSAHDFDSVARTLLESNKFIDALELVEGGTITHVYPLEGNESAIGYNILEDTAVNKEAFRTIRENQMFFAGPIRLKQGYDAIVGRLPIYRNGNYWGFSAVLIRLSTLIAAAELDSSGSRDYIFQLSKKDPNTGIEEFFLPNSASFDQKHSVSVNVTEGDWRIYARFVGTETITSQLSFAIIGFLFAVSGGLFAWFGARQPIRLKQQVEEKTRQLSESESTLRGAFEYTAIGMALVSPEGKWLKVNDALCKMLGYSKEEMLTMSFRDITHPDDMETGVRFLEEAKKSGEEFFREEKRYLNKYGAVIWVNLNVSAVKDNGGQLQYFVTQTEDITEKKKMTALLEVRENQLRLFIDRSPAALAMFDKDMRYLVTSKRWLSDYDLEGKQVIGKKHYELFPNLPERWKEIHRRCMVGAVEKSDDDFYVDEDGKLSWLKWEIHPWRHYNGEIGGIIMFTEVITRLKEAELKFRNLVEQSLVGVCIVQDGKYAYVNPRFAEIHGYTPEEMTESISDDAVIAEEHREMVKHKLAPLLKEGIGYVHFEAKGKRKNGELIYVEVYEAGTTFNGRPAMIGTLLEITERKKAQEKLEESEAKFRNLVEKSLAGVYILQDGKVKYINPAHERMMGYSLQALQNIQNIEELVHEEDIPVFRDHHTKENTSKDSHQPAIIRAYKRNGSMVYLEVTTSATIYEGRPALIGTMLNITDRVQEEIRISRAVNDAQERERMEIGMELHDNVKQILAASLLNVDHLATTIPDHKNAMDTIQNLKNYTKEAINELRRLSHQLAPSINKNDSFAEQINKLVVTMNADNSLNVNIDVDEGPQFLRADIRTAFYRILQEQIHNIMKYAQASSVNIAIKPEEKNVLLIIRDDGIGFDINTKKDGIGLENIRRRAFALSGKAKFISSPGNGCELIVQVPIA